MSWRRLRSVLAVSVVALFAASGASAESFKSAHWKSKMEIEGSRQDGRIPGEYEIWLKEGNMRTKAEMSGVGVNMLKIGDDVYTWMEGQPTGMKLNVAMGQRSNRPSNDYVNRVEEFRTKGKKIGIETVDGHPCEIWEYTDEQGTHGKYWLAQDLKKFPVKAELETRGGKVTYHNSDIQVPASVSDSMMAVPSDVQFQDMSEMMKGMRQKQ